MDKERIRKIINILSENFADKPALKYSTPYELLVAVILSAQCTDERVNKVTEKLFKEYNTPQKVVKLNEEQLERFIFSCGLYHTKAQYILKASKDIIEKFNGEVPDKLEELRMLSGVGRKTANVVYSVAFHGNAIAVDTHVFRVSNRIGFVNATDVFKAEQQLMKNLEEKDWSRTHHYLIYLGRSFCKAGKPNCINCPIIEYCEKNKVK